MTKARDLANIISGGFTESDIPNLSASKITSGTLDNARITLDANEIPNISTDKLTSGTIPDARLPSTALNSNVDLTTLSASNLTSGTIPTARITGLPSGVGGKVLQVVHASEGQVRSSTVQNWASISGLTLDITPSSTSSKILVICNFTLSSGNHGVVRIKRDSTVIGGGITASSNRQNTSMYMNANGNSARVQSMVHLDSPNKSSATTYFAEWYNNTNSPPIYLNRTPNDTDAVYGSRGLSTITLMEIAV